MSLVSELACKYATQVSLSAAQEQHQQACDAAFFTPWDSQPEFEPPDEELYAFSMSCWHSLGMYLSNYRFSSKDRYFRNQNFQNMYRKGLKNKNFEMIFIYLFLY